MSAELKTDERLACDQCGRYGAIDFGDKKLCPDCYASACSCCPEFDGNNESKED